MQKELDKDKIEREIQELVIERLKLIPSDKNISIGGASFTRSQIIDHVQKKDEIGMSTGLAWTEAGGDILFIEVALMPGKGNLTLTGHLGEVMKESCKAALSFIRSHWQDLKIYAGKGNGRRLMPPWRHRLRR